ncbi:MAG: hypothetical protein CMM91_00355 [Rickettsiales bacterium]|nr:hypothetical protein [Rickettsiales bacterium]|tara:strand:+ start:1309 stop:1950 length:642 start_codon:yes stop_codon:yes gene_type:complete
MPNWCNNNISITGPNSVIDKIEKITKEEDNKNGLLQFFNPMPKELEGTTSPSSSADKPQPMIDGFDCWYDWRVENWGTKWEVCEFYGVDRQYHSENNEGESTITFGFDSAWAPPINAYDQFLTDNSDCSLKAWYYEGGCDFMGEWDNGQDDCYQPSNYKSDDDFWNDGVGSTLDDYFGITESMAEYEAEQEAEKEDVHEYVKGQAMNIGEEIS